MKEFINFVTNIITYKLRYIFMLLFTLVTISVVYSFNIFGVKDISNYFIIMGYYLIIYIIYYLIITFIIYLKDNYNRNKYSEKKQDEYIYNLQESINNYYKVNDIFDELFKNGNTPIKCESNSKEIKYLEGKDILVAVEKRPQEYTTDKGMRLIESFDSMYYKHYKIEPKKYEYLKSKLNTNEKA